MRPRLALFGLGNTAGRKLTYWMITPWRSAERVRALVAHNHRQKQEYLDQRLHPTPDAARRICSRGFCFTLPTGKPSHVLAGKECSTSNQLTWALERRLSLEITTPQEYDFRLLPSVDAQYVFFYRPNPKIGADNCRLSGAIYGNKIRLWIIRIFTDEGPLTLIVDTSLTRTSGNPSVVFENFGSCFEGNPARFGLSTGRRFRYLRILRRGYGV